MEHWVSDLQIEAVFFFFLSTVPKETLPQGPTSSFSLVGESKKGSLDACYNRSISHLFSFGAGA